MKSLIFQFQHLIAKQYFSQASENLGFDTESVSIQGSQTGTTPVIIYILLFKETIL